MRAGLAPGARAAAASRRNGEGQGEPTPPTPLRRFARAPPSVPILRGEYTRCGDATPVFDTGESGSREAIEAKLHWRQK